MTARKEKSSKTLEIPLTSEMDYVPRNVYNYHRLSRYSQTRQEDYSNGVSLTKPDMSLSIPEILLRHTSGRPLPTLQDFMYHGDTQSPDFRTLDLVEKAEYAQWAKDHIVRVNDEYKKKMLLRQQKHAEEKANMNKILQFAAAYEASQKGGTTDGDAKSAAKSGE